MKDTISDQGFGDFFETVNSKNTELSAIFTLFRHVCELKMIEEGIEANKQVPTRNESKVKQIAIENTVNVYRRMKTQKLGEKKKQCEDNIAAFRAKCEAEGIELPDVSADNLKQIIAKTFESDPYGLQKICFAMMLCLHNDEENSFIYGNETIKDVSEILFDDQSYIKGICDKFFENFREISNGSFWERNKPLLIGIGATMLLAAFFGSALFGGVALLGMGGLGVAEIVRSKKVKDTFRQLQPNDIAAIFAMKATLIDYGMATMGEDRFKEELDECLVGLNDLRADLEYALIVEKSDEEGGKEKIKICNRFVDRLAMIAAA